MAKRPDVWLSYGGCTYKSEINGWYVGVISATIAAPHPWEGRTIWRYRMSRNTIVDGVWTDKNPLGRKFETAYYTSREEAEAAARIAATTP